MTPEEVGLFFDRDRHWPTSSSHQFTRIPAPAGGHGLEMFARFPLQWLANLQLSEAASHHNLYRDLALGCAFDGGEIAEAPQRFAEGVSR